MESALSVSNIKKTFVTKIKHSGLRGSFQSLIKPEDHPLMQFKVFLSTWKPNNSVTWWSHPLIVFYFHIPVWTKTI